VLTFHVVFVFRLSSGFAAQAVFVLCRLSRNGLILSLCRADCGVPASIEMDICLWILLA